MSNIRRSPINTLIILGLLSLLIVFGQATITTLRINEGEEFAQSIDLLVEDRVLIIYRIVGGKVNDMQFSIDFPNSTTKVFGSSGDFSYSFICDVEGEYMLNFVNTGQTEIDVTLDYEVQHYIFGIPQMLFMTIIIVLACIVGVVFFVLLGRTI